ncbi:MAG: hypothetical protein J5910_08935 [Lachnospiraceae bacterium]|nr:hypothetical protein [Lachnospiraceae bacterium]
MKKDMIRKHKGIIKAGICITLSFVLAGGMLPNGIYAKESEIPEVEVVDAVDADSIPDSAKAVEDIEINQGFSKHTKREGGKQTLIREFAANKDTAIMMKIPDSETLTQDEARERAKNYDIGIYPVFGGRESDDYVLYDSFDDFNFNVIKLYDEDCNPESGWYLEFIIYNGFNQGVYNFRITDSEGEKVGEASGIRFYETRDLNILIVPVKAYWGMAVAAPAPGAYSCKDGQFEYFGGEKRNWSQLRDTIKEYLMDTYPTANVNVTEGKEINASKMDLCTNDGRYDLWKAAKARQAKNRFGEDKYDLILAFVQFRQGDKGNIQGYTYRRPANIITYSDGDMLPTVGHEIAHCFEIGDDYYGGTYNPDVNLPPKGYKGDSWDFQSKITIDEGDWQDPEMYRDSTTDDKKSSINTKATGTMIPLSLHPFSLSRDKIITWEGVNEDGDSIGTVFPTMCFMSSGFAKTDNYWNSSVNWDHLLKSLIKKDKKGKYKEDDQLESDSLSNVDVFMESQNADMASDGIITEDDIYYDDDYRFGESNMVEVSGRIQTVDDKQTVTMDPMFSFEGDLEYIEPLEDEYKDSEEVYTFAALDEEGNIIKSPVDGEPAAVEFYAGRVPCGYMDESVDCTGDFVFDAEYPEGTADFAIMKGRIATATPGQSIWKASEDPLFAGAFEASPSGGLESSEYNEVTGEFRVKWNVEYPDVNKKLYSEVYYFPEGDDGDGYFVCCSDDQIWKDGDVSILTENYSTEECPGGWTRNAYVWIRVSNGINAVDIYSDDNELTLAGNRSEITLSGSGIKKETIDGVSIYSAVYTGKEITPQAAVKAYDPYKGDFVTLKKDVDYTVTYNDNVNTGIASVSVQGIGAWVGKNTQEFEISAKKIDGTPESIPDMKYTSDLDGTVCPYLMITDKSGSQLLFEDDFTVKYTVDGKTDEKLSALITADPAEKKEVTVTYCGTGNYTDTLKKTVKFNILPSGSATVVMSQENTTITLKADYYDYTGKPIKASVKAVTVNGTPLKSSDYSVIYTNNISIGTARVTVIGKKNYAGSAYKTYEIRAKQVTSLSVKGLVNQTYNGKEIDVNTLPIEVKAGGITLKKGRDYTVSAVEGCNYKNVTTSQIRKDKKAPAVAIKLVELSDQELRKTKAADRPIVRWKTGTAESKKTVSKTFQIVAIKLNSQAVSAVQKNSDKSANIVKSADGTSTIATLRSVTKEEAKNNKKYFFVIEGTADSLEKNAVLTEALALKTNDLDLKPGTDYITTVSSAGSGKIGSITIKAVKNGICTGSRTIKYLYTKK